MHYIFNISAWQVYMMEKRVEKRINFNVTGSVRYNGTTCTGDIENLSMKGMFLKACNEIPLDTEVKVSINLSGASSELVIHIDGKVARSDGGGIAVIFEKIDLDSYTHLRNIISYNINEEW